jgi:hypothetical protein
MRRSVRWRALGILELSLYQLLAVGGAAALLRIHKEAAFA